MKTKRLDPSNWKPGEATIFSALGFKQPGPYPQLGTPLTDQVATAQAGTSAPATGSAGGLSGNLSFSQLEQLWVNAGGNPKYKVIAAAIAMAESGGRQNAEDKDSNGTIDRGYWQINSVHGSQSTFDPLGNARAAIAISSNGTNWHPWVTFNTGAYLKFMPKGS